MPFKSEAQRRYFLKNRKALEKRGVDVEEWIEETGDKKLPERVSTHHKKEPILREADFRIKHKK